jgi:uncharacterized protein (TIGR02231 family)
MTRILTALMLLIPAWALAAPVQVTLFPASGMVTEISAAACEPADDGLWACTLTLPGQADPATLRFGRLPGKASVTDLSWTNRRDPDQAVLAPLLARLAELQAERDAARAELEGVRARMNFWKAQTRPEPQSLAAMRELAEEMDRNLHSGTKWSQELEGTIKDLDKAIADVEARIAAAAGRNRMVWDVRATFSGEAPAELSYSYILRDCGWTPRYRLEALPAQSRIDFTWQARVWQRSGQDWSGVNLLLATMQPRVQAQPGDLPPWEISPVQYFRKAGAPVMMEMAAGVVADQEAKSAAPRQIRHTTYAAWDMGRKSLPAGEERVLEIERTAWPAAFVHLMRPSLNDKAFVRASTEFETPQELPPGTAFFFMDGAMVDTREFSLSGREGDFFFGTDPLVTCETTLSDKKTGEKGLFGSKQTFLRTWSLTVRNASGRPVDVRIEEPRPLPRDVRIKVELATNPAPAKEDDPEVLAWNATVPAGGRSVVTLDLKVEAPEDLNIDPGWRW